MNTQANPTPSSPAGPWIYGPWLDLIVGCGAWSAPLLFVGTALAATHAHAWGSAFYLLAVVFNYPHFMATVYRAYHTREEFEKYRIFTLHLTVLLALTAILAHASFHLVPWVFTLYICWSPWHYTGQNFGLLMMFLRRGGAAVTAGERRLLHLSFIASYLMLLVSFHTGPSGDPIILSLGLPAKVALPARLLLGAAFAVLGIVALERLAQRSGLRAMVAPLTLLVSQFLWFVMPTLLELASGIPIPQTRYSSGILAVLHSAQYLWITSYYARREANASGQTAWRMFAYFGTMIAGGIALFIPGPWLVSYLFHFDFTVSFLIFTALVNIHHFILDGAIWKLRDTRIRALLVDRGARVATAARETGSAVRGATMWLAGKSPSARAFRLALGGVLLLWGAVDQIHYFLVTDEGNLTHLLRAANLNPYDSSLQLRIARVKSQTGKSDEAIAALSRAVAANPANPWPQHALARAMIEDHRYTEAYDHYRRMLATFPRDPDALVNFGLLAAKLGHADEAVKSWQKAVEVDAGQVNAQLYLAEALDRQDRPADAVPHYEAFLKLAAAHTDQQHASSSQVVSVAIKLGDALMRINQPARAVETYQSAATLAERDSETQLESLALAQLADLQEKEGDAAAAARSYQRSLALDAHSTDARSEAAHWFNYGEFLSRRGALDELAYACFLRAESLLEPASGAELATIKKIRAQTETRLGRKAAAVRKELAAVLAKATSLQDSALTGTGK